MSDKGFYRKFEIVRLDGKPKDPRALYFILRYDNDSDSREALRLWAGRKLARDPNSQLAKELIEMLDLLDTQNT